MTTAHRPTFDPAKGKKNPIITSISHARSLPSHTKLKYRQRGQGGDADADRLGGDRESLQKDLLAREEEHQRLVNKRRKIMAVVQDQDQDIVSSEDEAVAEPPQVALLEGSKDYEKENGNDVDDDSEESDESGDDDTAALMLELAKIKQERAQEKERLDREQKQREIAFSNPLLNNDPNSDILDSFTVKRRWDDDTMFKNQAQRGANDNAKNFINDTLRSDFHRKFLNKYIR